MNLSPAGEALIKGFEGLRLTAYQDIGGKWTIGYGHLISPTDPHEISLVQADAYFDADVAWAVDAVNKTIRDVPTSQHQFDAMVSLCFNIGVENFATSSIRRYHFRRDYDIAARYFSLWDKVRVNGKLEVSLGLYRRRVAEAKFYLIPDDEAPEAA